MMLQETFILFHFSCADDFTDANGVDVEDDLSRSSSSSSLVEVSMQDSGIDAHEELLTVKQQTPAVNHTSSEMMDLTLQQNEHYVVEQPQRYEVISVYISVVWYRNVKRYSRG